MFRYGQIDEANVLMAISNLARKVEADNMIPLDEDFNPELRTKQYIDGEWVDYEEPIPEPPEQGINMFDVTLEIAVNLEYLVALEELKMGEI